MACALPAGWHTVTPRIVVEDPAAFVAFLKRVFDAAGEFQASRPSEIAIGDSLLMVSAAVSREPFPAFLYVYVENADATYQRALDEGAVSVEAVWDTPYGDRRGMVRDRLGEPLAGGCSPSPVGQATPSLDRNRWHGRFMGGLALRQPWGCLSAPRRVSCNHEVAHDN